MPTPTVSASLNRTTYAPGDPITLTVNYGDTDTQSITITVQATDSTGATSEPTTVTAVIDPTTLTVTSEPDRTWVKQSDNGTVAVFTATA